MIHCGIDTSNRSSALCMMDDQGKVLVESNCPMSLNGFRQALKGYEELNCVVEASPWAETVKGWAEQSGHRCTIIDSRAAKRAMDAMKKTDPRDAKTLAHLARTGFYRAVHAKSDKARQLRSELQAYKGMQATKKAQASRIRGLLRAHGLRVGQVSEGKFAEHVVEVVKKGAPQLLWVMKLLLRSWEQAYDAVKAMKKVFKHRAKEVVPAVLLTVPGVGELIGLAYVATIDTPDRFQRGDQVGDYVGLAPRVSQSADVCYRGRITKEGDGLLRVLLNEGAHVLLTRYQGDCALKRWGLRKAAEKGPAKARVAVARKLAVLLWTLWKRNEAFNPWPEGRARAA